MKHPTSPANQDGSVVLETVLLAPLIILVLAAIIGAARVTLAHQRVDSAAAQAARAASTAPSAGTATSRATNAARAFLTDHGLDCTSMTVTADTADFHPGGSVTVTVGCRADLGAGVPGLSGRRSISGRSTEVIDTYRQVTP